MYTVEFYENDRGVSELWDFLEELRIKSASNKDARIQYKQIVLYPAAAGQRNTAFRECDEASDGWHLGAASGK